MSKTLGFDFRWLVAWTALVALALPRPTLADEWPTQGLDAARSRASAELSGAAFTDGSWTFSLPKKVMTVSSPAVADDLVVFGAFDGVVRALRASDGSVAWEHKVGDAIYAAPAIHRGKVFVPALDKKLHALRLRDGAALWTKDLGGLSMGSPSVIDGALVMAAGFPERTIFKIDPMTGKTLWRTPASALAQFSNSAVAATASQLVVGANDGRYHAFDLATGSLQWTYTAGGVVNLSAPVIAGGRAYMLPGGASTRLYGVDVLTGAALPGWPTDLPIAAPDVDGRLLSRQLGVSSLVLAQDRLVFDVRVDDSIDTNADGPPDRYLLREVLMAVDPTSGRVAWQQPNGRSVLVDPNDIPKFWVCPTPAAYAAKDGAVLVAAASTVTSTVRVLDAATGTELWTAPLGAPAQASPVLANGQLFVATRRGVQSFASATNHAPSAPALLAPDGQLSAGSREIRWSPSTDADGDAISYSVRFDHDGEVLEDWEREVVVPDGAAASTITWPEGLVAGATYLVAMRARDTRGAMSAWSSPVTFRAPEMPPITVDGRAFNRLEDAVLASSPGSIIELAPGITHLTDTVRLPPGAALRGSGAGVTVLDGANVGVALRIDGGVPASRTRVSGLTVQRARVGLAVEGAADAELVNVVVHDSADTGIDVAAGSSAQIVNATLVRNGIAVRSSGITRIRNSLLTANRTALWAAEPGRIESRYNNLFSNDEPLHDVASGAGDMSAEVTFADAARSDFHILRAQASTDQGDPGDAVGDEPAPNGGRVNLGAFGGTSSAERSAQPSAQVPATPAPGSPIATAPPAASVPAASADAPPARSAGGCSVATGSGSGSPTVVLVAAALVLVGRRRRGSLAATAVLTLLFASSAHAATAIWGGGTGAWSTGANWIGGAAPGASDTASFSGWAPLDRSGWTITTSVGLGASNAKDGKWSTRWTTGTNAASGQWYKIDLGSTQTFSRLVLDDTGDGSDYPPAFDVYVSSDGSAWGSAIASGTGSAPLTTINFPAQTARYIKVQLTAGGTHWWSNRETFVYATAGTDDTQLARSGWTASASHNTGAAALAIDSALSTRWDTGTNAANGQWFKVDMGAAVTVDRVDFSSYTDDNDFPPSYAVSVSTDDVSYTSVATGSPSSALVSATFSARSARYIKVTCTSAGSYYFSIHDFNAYGMPRTASIGSSISIGGITLARGSITQSSGAAIALSGDYTQSGGTFTGGNSAITATNFAQSAGTFTSTSGTLTVSGAFTQTGGTFSSAAGSLNCSSATQVGSIATGASYAVGSGMNTFAGGLTVGGTLTMATSGGTLAIGENKTLTIEGTLNASTKGATIQASGSAGAKFNFKVGTTASSRPTLNITGLTVKNTTTDGMYVNAHQSSITTFTRFDNIAFSNGAGAQLLQIQAASLNLTSTGCTFDAGLAAGTTTYNVTLKGNGTADGDTRATFGGSTCATDRTPCSSYKLDDDAGNGTAASPSSDGAVIQFLSAAVTDTAGSIIGFPTQALDWNTFVTYSVYVAFHNANGSADRIFVRDNQGVARYYWEAPSGDAIIGTPRWETEGGVHYLYVATLGGKVYRLVDNTVALSLAPDTAAPWSGSYFDCGCTISTPLTLDTNNLYWAGSIGGVSKLWTLGKVSQGQPAGSPLNTSATVGSASPALWRSGDSYVYLGMPGRISKVDVTTQVNVADNTNPGGTNTVDGRITIMNNVLYAGDSNGYFWAIDAGSDFAGSNGTSKLWSYHDAANHAACGGVCGIQNFYRDASLGRVYYGDQDGHVYVVNDSGAAVSGFPFRPGSSTDAFTTSPLYRAGVIVIGTSTGTLYMIDQNSTGSAPALIKTYKFGPTTQISSIAFDNATSAYLVSTADPTAKDGKLYYIAAIADPTPTYQ